MASGLVCRYAKRSRKSAPGTLLMAWSLARPSRAVAGCEDNAAPIRRPSRVDIVDVLRLADRPAFEPRKQRVAPTEWAAGRAEPGLPRRAGLWVPGEMRGAKGAKIIAPWRTSPPRIGPLQFRALPQGAMRSPVASDLMTSTHRNRDMDIGTRKTLATLALILLAPAADADESGSAPLADSFRARAV